MLTFTTSGADFHLHKGWKHELAIYRSLSVVCQTVLHGAHDRQRSTGNEALLPFSGGTMHSLQNIGDRPTLKTVHNGLVRVFVDVFQHAANILPHLALRV